MRKYVLIDLSISDNSTEDGVFEVYDSLQELELEMLEADNEPENFIVISGEDIEIHEVIRKFHVINGGKNE